MVQTLFISYKEASLKVCFIGVGYVGLVTAATFADLGNEVTCVNRDKEKSQDLKKGIIPIYEPDLEEMVKRNVRVGRLSFTTDYQGAVPHADVVFIAVGTPSLPSGDADLSQIEAAAEEIGRNLSGFTVVATKSTVPVGTNRKVEGILASNRPGGATFAIASVPEFLREGSAVYDTLHPDRIVIGTESEKAREMLIQLHKPLKTLFVLTSIESAEMLKYTANSFLAMKISFANAIAQICEKVGADVVDVMDGIGMDKRIGRAFLYPGPGYGGSCFPKDVKALIAIAEKSGYDFKLLKTVENINEEQIALIVAKVVKTQGRNGNKTVGVLGLAFKANTDDVRQSQPIKIIHELTKRGYTVRAYDPIAGSTAKRYLTADKAHVVDTVYEAARGADVLLVVTEWDEFLKLDFGHLGEIMHAKTIVDARNLYDPDALKAMGWTYVGIGR